MTTQFSYDVFLNYSPKDKPVARQIAQRLRSDGLNVWFDEWIIRSRDDVSAMIEDGLERSRVLVLFMSANAFASDWERLEACALRFRDPLNPERRFIPLRLDSAPIKSSLDQVFYVDWRYNNREQEYTKLLDACHAAALRTAAAEIRATNSFTLDFSSSVYAWGFAPDRKQVLVSANLGEVGLWDLEDDAHKATAAKLYLQLKSGDSYRRTRKRGGAEVFAIKEERHVRYWMAQAFPVLLVIRNSEGEVQWMEVRDWLKRASEDGTKPVKQIIFEGERFDVMSVRRWRDRVLGGTRS